METAFAISPTGATLGTVALTPDDLRAFAEHVALLPGFAFGLHEFAAAARVGDFARARYTGTLAMDCCALLTAAGSVPALAAWTPVAAWFALAQAHALTAFTSTLRLGRYLSTLHGAPVGGAAARGRTLFVLPKRFGAIAGYRVLDPAADLAAGVPTPTRPPAWCVLPPGTGNLLCRLPLGVPFTAADLFPTILESRPDLAMFPTPHGRSIAVARRVLGPLLDQPPFEGRVLRRIGTTSPARYMVMLGEPDSA